MKNVEGLRTAIVAAINKREKEQRLALDVDDIIDQVKTDVNVDDVPIGWLMDFALKAATEVTLYQEGYRSVVKGEGLFVNPDNCEKPEYYGRLFNNAKLAEVQKKKIVDMLVKRIKDANIEGQLRFDLSSGTVVEDMTEQQLIEMLKEDAKTA